MNSWTENNSNLREKIVTHGNPDIICLTETHLKKEGEIKVEGYQFYGLN